MAPKKRTSNAKAAAAKVAKDVDMEPSKAMDAEWSSKDDKRPRTKVRTEMREADAMASCTVAGQLVTTVATGGFHCLLSGARASTGIKSGRYLYELTVLDAAHVGDQAQQQWKTIRAGFATSDGSLIPGSDALSFSVDNDANVWFNGRGAPADKQRWRWQTGDVVGIFLNLEKGSTHANTMSVFCNGVRSHAPFPLPDALHGKVLFPVIAMRNAAGSVNFGKAGARPLKELPFKATLLDCGAAADLVESTAKATDKPEVVVPVGLPNEGTFDFLDHDFYPSHGKYEECSERALVAWLERSGLRGNPLEPRSFKVRELDDGTLLKAYAQLLATRKRNCVLMDVRQNLTAKARAAAIAPFVAPWWTKKAVVAMGKAPKAFVEKVKAGVVAKARASLEDSVGAEKALFEQRQTQRKAQEEKNAATAAAADKAVAAAMKAVGETNGAAAKAKAKEEVPDWAAKMKVDEAALTKGIDGFNSTGKRPADMFPEALARCFMDFTLPAEGAVEVVDARWLESGEPPAPKGGEGFDVVEFAPTWSTKAQAGKYLETYKKERKVQEKFFDLKVGEDFKEQVAAWTTAKAELKTNVDAHAGRVKAQKERESKPKPAEEPKAEEEKKEGDVEMADASKDAPKEAADEYDYAGVELDAKAADVHDADGHKSPLYKDFEQDDHLLLQARAELHMLVRAFARDATDPERKGIAPNLVEHYYQVYYKHALRAGDFGHENVEALLKHCSDTVVVKDGVLRCVSDEDLPLHALVRAVEAARRDRRARLASGDETAKLRFQRAYGGKGNQHHGGKGYQQRPYGMQQPMHQQGFAPKRPYGMMQQGMQQGGMPAKRPMPGPGMGFQQPFGKGYGKGW